MSGKRIAIIDIETNDLLENMVDFSEFPYKLKPTAKLWCVVVTDYHTGVSETAELNEITKDWMKKTLAPYSVAFLHNGHKFDLISLKLFGVLDYKIGWLGEKDSCFGREFQFYDSLILSRLFDPNRFGGHSLKAWGQRTGEFKDDYRKQCIEAGYIDTKSPQGEEFRKYNPLMLPYCIQDTLATREAVKMLLEEWKSYSGWNLPIQQEHILADVSIKREMFGFSFNKKLALEHVAELDELINNIRAKIVPLLPPKKMTKGDIKKFTPPKTQLTSKNTPSNHMVKFTERVGGKITNKGDVWCLEYKGKTHAIPFDYPLEEYTTADIKDLDHVKQTLIDEYGWKPTEWKKRNLKKDSTGKKEISLEQSHKALLKYLEETSAGKYKKQRLEFIMKEYKIADPNKIYDVLWEAINGPKKVEVLISPPIKVGVEKELCPNLVKLGDEVSFAKDFADYLTYRHRKSCIAGGDTDGVDLEEDTPDKGYLSFYREIDGRIPTPAIEIGAVSNRYTHIGVTNVARVTSLYGKQLRELFGCGDDWIQLGFDFSSLEARVQGHYVTPYPTGVELTKSLVAEKPLDVHTLNSEKMGVDRSSAKSLYYAILYGCFVPKIMEMLSVSKKRAEEIFDSFWEAVPSLKAYKEDLDKLWEKNDKKFIYSIDGRKILTRSSHSLLNFVFQSSGVIVAKYVTIFIMEEAEKRGLCIDPFEGKPDLRNMIDYHDESQLAVRKDLIHFKTFETKEEGEEFIRKWDKKQGLLSALTHGKKWYVALPCVPSQIIENSIKRAETLLKANVEFGFEWIVGRNWADCH